jgi:hypothetical protein
MSAGLPLKENFVQELQKAKVYDRMKNLFHTAASVSPIVALLSNRFQNFSAKRYHFIAVSLWITVLFILDMNKS